MLPYDRGRGVLSKDFLRISKMSSTGRPKAQGKGKLSFSLVESLDFFEVYED